MKPGSQHSEATRRLLSERARERWARVGAEERALSEDHKRKIGEANRGRERSRAARARIKAAAYRRWARVRAEREAGR